MERPQGIDPPSRLALRLDKEPPGSAAFERGWRAAPAYVPRREHLRRTVRIALLVGIVLTTVNQLDVIVRGDATRLPGSTAARTSWSPSWSPPGVAQRAQHRAPGAPH